MLVTHTAKRRIKTKFDCRNAVCGNREQYANQNKGASTLYLNGNTPQSETDEISNSVC